MAFICNALDDFKSLNKQSAASYTFKFHHKSIFLCKNENILRKRCASFSKRRYFFKYADMTRLTENIHSLEKR